MKADVTNRHKPFTRIKRMILGQVKRPLRPLIPPIVSVAQYVGQVCLIPRDKIGAKRNRNAVFLWIPKTAGATLYSALDKQICTKILDLPAAKLRFQNKGLVTFGHLEYAQLVKEGLVETQFDESAFKFLFCRNPYSRAVSLYCFSKRRRWINEQMSFLEFCRKIESGVHDIGLFNVQGLSLCNPQSRWLKGVCPDFIGRMENFDEDLGRLFQLLNLTVPEMIISKNLTEHSPYREYYCPKSRDIVARYYAEDFKRFAYSVKL